MANQDDILTHPEVAGLLKVVEETLYDPAQKGNLPAFKVGGSGGSVGRLSIHGSN